MIVQHEEWLAGQAMEAKAYEEAARLLRPLAERNSEYALLTLGWIYETGATGTLDQDAAQAFYEQAAAQGSAAAYRSLGRVLLNGGQEMEARAAFERGAQLNNDECKSELARLADYYDEKLASEALKLGAYDEAVRLLLPLAERNSQYALLCLGFIYERGDTGAPDWEAARSCYERAASVGSADALLCLGFIYERGDTGAPDWEAARSCYERAASLGSADGSFELGRLLKRQGDETKARTAFQTGAERGHLPSMSRLGRMMVEGRGGPTDLEAGTAWLEKAAANGHILAQRMLLRIEGRNANSIFEKLSVAVKIVALGIRGAREMSKDPWSDKVR